MFRKLLSTGVRQASRNLIRELRLSVHHRRSARRARKYWGHAPLQLHLGCGKVLKPGWVNIDLGSSVADLRLDLREPLPFPDDSVSIIYSEHFFEHLGYPDEARHFLRESIRVLRPGGLFDVGVPDTEWPITAYTNDDRQYFQFVRDRWHPEWCNLRMHNINFHFRQDGEHQYAYDFETLAAVLEGAGFTAIHRREFNPEQDSDPYSRGKGTLYVTAIKPG